MVYLRAQALVGASARRTIGGRGRYDTMMFNLCDVLSWRIISEGVDISAQLHEGHDHLHANHDVLTPFNSRQACTSASLWQIKLNLVLLHKQHATIGKLASWRIQSERSADSNHWTPTAHWSGKTIPNCFADRRRQMAFPR